METLNYIPLGTIVYVLTPDRRVVKTYITEVKFTKTEHGTGSQNPTYVQSLTYTCYGMEVPYGQVFLEMEDLIDYLRSTTIDNS